MQKITLLSIVMPMFMLASDQPTAQQDPILRGFAVLSWQRPLPAKEVIRHYCAKDVEWLNVTLGTEIDLETPMLRVLIEPKDGKLPQYLNDRVCFKNTRTQEKVNFPGWLPLAWFQEAKNGDVVTRKFFGKAIEIVCDKQAGGKLFHAALAGLMGPQQFAECEIAEMDDLTASLSLD